MIDLNLPPEKYVITLEKKHFQRSYSIYILELIHQEQRYYFIEHLTDNQNISAKLAIRRVGGHLEDANSSRVNQLYKYILNHIIEPYKDPNRAIDDKQKHLVEQFLLDCKINVHVYPLMRFHFPDLNKKQHQDNVKKVKVFEGQIIRMFDRASKKLMNDDIPSMYVRYDDIEFPKVWEQIKIDFYV